MMPAGALAPAKAPRSAKREVKALVQRQQAELDKYTTEQLRVLLPALRKAEADCAALLRQVVEQDGAGELRWSAQRYRVAVAQLRAITHEISRQLYGRLDEGVEGAQVRSIADIQEQMARFSVAFEGSLRTIPLDVAAIVAKGDRMMIPRIRSSAARYRGAVFEDIRERLAADILSGASIRETAERLAQSGGPKGFIALQGVAGDPNAVLEFIPEGLFQRYRFWATRIVRTELVAGYNQAAVDSIEELAADVPDLGRIWIADTKACIDCRRLDGKTAKGNDTFPNGAKCPPAHPLCRCSCGAWRPGWN